VWVGLSGLVLLSLIVAGQEVRRAPSGTGVLERLAGEAASWAGIQSISQSHRGNDGPYLDQAFHITASWSSSLLAGNGSHGRRYIHGAISRLRGPSRPTRTGALAASPLTPSPRNGTSHLLPLADSEILFLKRGGIANVAGVR